MSDKPLLLPGAKSGILLSATPAPLSLWRIVALTAGIVVICVGAADVVSRMANEVFAGEAAFISFAPAVAILNPSILGSATSTSFVPAQIKVPSIGVAANVEKVGVNPDGTMGTPNTFGNVGWYSLGVHPGDPGSAVFAGHVNNALTTAGVFQHLSQIHPGDKIILTSKEGQMLTYSVKEINEYVTDTAPTDKIFARSGPSQIVLVTCEGSWDEKAHAFNKRLVVVARQVSI